MMYHYCSYANGLLFVLLCALSLLCRVVQKRKKKCGRSFWKGIGEMIYFCSSSSMYVNTTKLCCV